MSQIGTRFSRERVVLLLASARRVCGGTELPYLCHPAMVAIEMVAALAHHLDANGDHAVQCALLHDTLEDTKATFEELSERFGVAVADGVLALSKSDAAAAGKSGIRL